MDAILQYDWLFFLVIVAGATFVLWLRDAARSREHPELRARSNRRALVFLFWAGLPWAVIGAGVLTGQIAGTADAFNLNAGMFPIFVISSIVAVWVALFFWLFKRGGAEELAESGHLWLGLRPLRDAASIKLLFVAAVLGGVIGLIAAVIASTS